MNVLLLLAHPTPGSFNHAIVARSEKVLTALGHRVISHDLYAEDFPPLLPTDEVPREGPVSASIARHCDELATAGGVVIVHPNWWGMPPAVLKGYLDRVFRPGVAYEFVEGDGGEGVPIGLLDANSAVIFNTSNTPLQRELEVFGDPLDTLWRNCVFGLCGVDHVCRHMFETICVSTPEQRRQWLDAVEETIEEVFGREH